MRELMPLQLTSDFVDFYDHAFDNYTKEPHDVLIRRSHNNIIKREQFQLLATLGLNAVEHGYGHPPKYLKDEKFVIYTDEYAHRGEGKKLVSYNQVKTFREDRLWSVYIPQPKAQSVRFLYIGHKMIKLEYTQKNKDWRSNYGDVKINIIGTWDVVNTFLPLYAVDFVEGYAVDLNTAPGIGGTGVETLFDAEQVVNYLKYWAMDQDKYRDQFFRRVNRY